MKKLLLLLLCMPLIGYGQINIGANQTICLGDTAEVIALLQGGGQGAGMDRAGQAAVRRAYPSWPFRRLRRIVGTPARRRRSRLRRHGDRGPIRSYGD